MAAMHSEPRSVYRVEGLSCANCAAMFEKNVRALPRVEDAQINFGACKLTVYGEASLSELEQAGAFDGLRVFAERERPNLSRLPLWRRRSTWMTLLCALFLLAGLISGESPLRRIALYALAIITGGYPMFVKGLRSLLRFDFTMNALMTIAIIGAAAIGQWSEGATVVLLFAISEALETFSMEKARSSIRLLMKLTPQEAIVRRGEKEQNVRADDIDIGDVLLVKPGQSIAADGVVRLGTSPVSQAALTGESIPVVKTAGDEVYAGTWNGSGYLEIEVTKRTEDFLLAKMIRLVEEAQGNKAPAQAFIDRFAKVYTPAVVLAAAVLALVPPLFTGDWGSWLYRALALLVVGCPCALVISTPVAVLTAIGSAAQQGVLIKGGVYMELLGKVKSAAFDKTGTLTIGEPSVTDFIAMGRVEKERLLGIAEALERRSDHPLAAAVVSLAEREAAPGNGNSFAVTDTEGVTGKGVRGKIDGAVYVIGSPSFVGETVQLTASAAEAVHRLRAEGKTAIVMANETERRIEAVVGVADELRPSARQALSGLRSLGLSRLVMLTGDHRQAAERIADRAGIAEVHAELLPQHKVEAVRSLKEQGGVAMVGDGINDAPALAAATIGVTMGGAGTDAALELADVVIMGDDLAKLPYAIRISRKTLSVIRSNIALALGLKLLALALLIPDWLTLWMAIIADMGATLLVTLNSLRLLRVKG